MAMMLCYRADIKFAEFLSKLVASRLSSHTGKLRYSKTDCLIRFYRNIFGDIGSNSFLLT